jgi:hypothetical protein
MDDVTAGIGLDRQETNNSPSLLVRVVDGIETQKDERLSRYLASTVGSGHLLYYSADPDGHASRDIWTRVKQHMQATA